jgi:hypothetical protein
MLPLAVSRDHGMYQTSIGTQNHRSVLGKEKILLPAGVLPARQFF